MDETMDEAAGDQMEEDQLHRVLDELGVLDSEVGTINTRLARRDIDSMFFSPVPPQRCSR